VKRIGEEVSRELGRFGPEARIAAFVEAWPAAVGETIARSAWPARVARDGTLHVNTADSIWAFELTSRAGDVAQRLGVERVKFAPGRLPETGAPEHQSEQSPPLQASPEHQQEAARLAAEIEDADLRKIVARAAAASLARAGNDRQVW
jgi:predicted nucleic acid-binding Zn ribbon protein